MSEDYGSSDFLDVAVGVHGLRTFAITPDGKLGSVSQGTGHWNNGVCVAICRVNNDPDHKVPAPSPCRCGIYATLSLDVLFRQWAEQASQVVCVIAAEGKTMLGTLGMRTAAARIVAYWCAEDIPEWGWGRVGDLAPMRSGSQAGLPHVASKLNIGEVLARECPGARRFRDMRVMARLYGLR